MGAAISLGEHGVEVARNVRDGNAAGGRRWWWVERSFEPLPGVPAGLDGQWATFEGMNHHLGVRIRETMDVAPSFEEAVAHVLATIPLRLVHPLLLASAPAWNLGLGLRLSHLSPAGLEVVVELFDEVPDLERLVTIAEDATR